MPAWDGLRECAVFGGRCKNPFGLTGPQAHQGALIEHPETRDHLVESNQFLVVFRVSVADVGRAVMVSGHRTVLLLHQLEHRSVTVGYQLHEAGGRSEARILQVHEQLVFAGKPCNLAGIRSYGREVPVLADQEFVFACVYPHLHVLIQTGVVVHRSLPERQRIPVWSAVEAGCVLGGDAPSEQHGRAFTGLHRLSRQRKRQQESKQKQGYFLF